MNGGYGKTDEEDLWGIIQDKSINKKYDLKNWFVPSRAEWSAFGDMLSTYIVMKETLDESDIINYGLNDNLHWTSSQRSDELVWASMLQFGGMLDNTVDASGEGYYSRAPVRLSAIF